MTVTTNDPHAEQFAELLHNYLGATAQLGGSDLHMRAGEPPFVRRNGQLLPIPEAPVLTDENMAGFVLKLTERLPSRRAEFKEAGEADLSYELPGIARFRVNIFRERGNTAMTLRLIPNEVPQLDKLGVPPVLSHIAMENHGLILVTGATGSGKTTTLAAMLDHINRNCHKHILTIEDPIEIVHPNHSCVMTQREIGTDTNDFKQALRRALRQDPDVILIGEIRDQETMKTALEAAETGHLVFATLHTINATETIARVLDLFPPEQEKQARAMLAGALKGVISQRLARTVDDGRVAVVEVMVHTARVADCIMNPEDTGKLPEAIAGGEYYGMQTFDQALIRLIVAGRITEEEAMNHVSSPQNFRLQLETTKAQLEVDMQRMAAEEAQRMAAEQAMQAQAEAEAAAAAAAGAAMGTPPPEVAPVPGEEAPAVPVPVPVPGSEAAPPPPPAAVPVPGAEMAPAATQAPVPGPVPVPGAEQSAAPAPPPPAAPVPPPGGAVPPPPAAVPGDAQLAPTAPPPAAAAEATVPPPAAVAPVDGTPPPPPPSGEGEAAFPPPPAATAVPTSVAEGAPAAPVPAPPPAAPAS